MAVKTEPREAVESLTPKPPSETSVRFAGIIAAARKWGLAVVAIALLGAAIVVALSRAETAPVTDPAPPLPPIEVDLGRFTVAPISSGGGSPAMVEFQLHVTFSDQRDGPARHQLETRRFRVRQHVEELLRRATIDDFDDATLVGLKRQIQAQINDGLELQAVRDVIITDLRLTK